MIARVRRLRTEGGFAQLGLPPRSRIFGARPTGRNADWSLCALYGVDQAKLLDPDCLGAEGARRYSTMAIGTLNCGLNRCVSLLFEQPHDSTHANAEVMHLRIKNLPPGLGIVRAIASINSRSSRFKVFLALPHNLWVRQAVEADMEAASPRQDG